jgi:hypothetical protein
MMGNVTKRWTSTTYFEEIGPIRCCRKLADQHCDFTMTDNLKLQHGVRDSPAGGR